jgi:glutamyl-tRNA synthetase
MSVANADLGDPVLVRRDRTPTFFLASSVDDAVDGVTHLVRPDPMRRLMAQQIHIWRCLGYPPPRIGHIPLVTAANRAPLRTGQTDFTIAALRARGISADALVMYLAMPKTASWKIPPTGPGDIVSSVDLGRVSRRPFTFDLRAVELLSRRLARARRHLPLESAQVLCG